VNDERKKHVFISYSWKDSSVAEQVKESIPTQFEVWFDIERICPGASVSTKILEGLRASDYYIIIISESSNESNWVKREISMAFELANNKKLSVVPVLLQGSEVPLEFKGLLYIDFRQSVADGLHALREFLISQDSLINDIEPRHMILKSQSEHVQQRIYCNELLREMSLGDLRHLVTERLNIEEVEVIWFDLFGRRMVDEINVRNLALSCVELMDRSETVRFSVYL